MTTGRPPPPLGCPVPATGEGFANPDLAAMWTRLLAEAEAARSREGQIEAARAAFCEGFVAEAVGACPAEAKPMDVSGTPTRACSPRTTWGAGKPPTKTRLP